MQKRGNGQFSFCANCSRGIFYAPIWDSETPMAKMATQTLIVESSDNRLFAVRETNDPDLAHVFHAIPMKRAKGGGFAVKGDGHMLLLRKAGCRIVAVSL